MYTIWYVFVLCLFYLSFIQLALKIINEIKTFFFKFIEVCRSLYAASYSSNTQTTLSSHQLFNGISLFSQQNCGIEYIHSGASKHI